MLRLGLSVAGELVPPEDGPTVLHFEMGRKMLSTKTESFVLLRLGHDLADELALAFVFEFEVS